MEELLGRGVARRRRQRPPPPPPPGRIRRPPPRLGEVRRGGQDGHAVGGFQRGARPGRAAVPADQGDAVVGGDEGVLVRWRRLRRRRGDAQARRRPAAEDGPAHDAEAAQEAVPGAQVRRRSVEEVHVKSMKQHKQSICKLHHLRTVICIGPLVDDADDVFHQVLQNLKRLRVLSMCFYNKKNDLNLLILLFSYRVQSLPKKLCNLSKLLSFEPYREGSYRKRLYAELPQIPYIDKLTSLQNLDEFRVQKQKGYEPRQLRDMNGLGRWLSITHLENVTRKDEAAEMMLHKKRYLEHLELIWSNESDSHAEDSLHLDILEGPRPPAKLQGLAIEGYKSDRYPSWLLEGSYFDNLDLFGLHDCTALEGLPLNTEVFRHCFRLVIWDVPCLPEGMADVSIKGCPLLMFISSNKMREHDKRENIVMPEQLVSQLCLIWELDSGSHPVIKSNLHEEHSSLKQLTPLVDADISQHLQTISGTLEQEIDEVYDKETVIKAWLCCHEQRIKLLYGTNIGQQLLLPSILVAVPVFIRDGKIVGRYVGSGKGELVGEILRYNGVRVTY